jgi:hypothetical protein
MIRQLVLILSAFLSIVPASAQTSSSSAPDPADVRVLMQTEQGPIVLAVHSGKAPVTAANFRSEAARWHGLLPWRWRCRLWLRAGRRAK